MDLLLNSNKEKTIQNTRFASKAQIEKVRSKEIKNEKSKIVLKKKRRTREKINKKKKNENLFLKLRLKNFAFKKLALRFSQDSQLLVSPLHNKDEKKKENSSRTLLCCFSKKIKSVRNSLSLFSKKSMNYFFPKSAIIQKVKYSYFERKERIPCYAKNRADISLSTSKICFSKSVIHLADNAEFLEKSPNTSNSKQSETQNNSFNLISSKKSHNKSQSLSDPSISSWLKLSSYSGNLLKESNDPCSLKNEALSQDAHSAGISKGRKFDKLLSLPLILDKNKKSSFLNLLRTHSENKMQYKSTIPKFTICKTLPPTINSSIKELSKVEGKSPIDISENVSSFTELEKEKSVKSMISDEKSNVPSCEQIHHKQTKQAVDLMTKICPVSQSYLMSLESEEEPFRFLFQNEKPDKSYQQDSQQSYKNLKYQQEKPYEILPFLKKRKNLFFLKELIKPLEAEFPGRPKEVKGASIKTAMTHDFDDLEIGNNGRNVRDISKLCPKLCRVFGSGLTQGRAGEILNFTVQAADELGRFIKKGGMKFDVYVEEVEERCIDLKRNVKIKQTHIVDNRDGSYFITFVCLKACTYKIEVYYNENVLVGDSPYFVDISPGSINPSKCFATGEGLHTFSSEGYLMSINIKARDSFGNDIKRGGDEFDVDGIGCLRVVDLIDQHNGTYNLTYYVPKEAVDQYCELHIKVIGKHIEGSPFKPKTDKRKVEIEEEKTILPVDYVDDINPCRSLHKIMELFNKETQDILFPHACTWHPYPSYNEIYDILRKVTTPLQPLTTYASTVKLTEYKNKLELILKVLKRKQKVMNEMTQALLNHSICGENYKNTVEENRKNLVKSMSDVMQSQKQLHTTYRAIQYEVLEKLPIKLEIEDPESVKRKQAKTRNNLIELHKELMKKEEELRKREEVFVNDRNNLVNSLITNIEKRKNYINAQKVSYDDSTNLVLLDTVKKGKKHLRREVLSACEKDAVEAVTSEFCQLEFMKQLNSVDKCCMERRSFKPHEKVSDVKEQVKAERSPELLRFIPDDNTTPAYWFCEGRYIKNEMKCNSENSKYLNTKQGKEENLDYYLSLVDGNPDFVDMKKFNKKEFEKIATYNRKKQMKKLVLKYGSPTLVQSSINLIPPPKLAAKEKKEHFVSQKEKKKQIVSKIEVEMTNNKDKEIKESSFPVQSSLRVSRVEKLYSKKTEYMHKEEDLHDRAMRNVNISDLPKDMCIYPPPATPPMPILRDYQKISNEKEFFKEKIKLNNSKFQENNFKENNSNNDLYPILLNEEGYYHNHHDHYDYFKEKLKSKSKQKDEKFLKHFDVSSNTLNAYKGKEELQKLNNEFIKGPILKNNLQNKY